MPCAAAGPGPGDDAAVGVDHNRGEKKFPYAKSRLTTVLGGMENVQLMTIPQRLRNQLVTLLAIAKPDTTTALNLIFVFWICAFKGVYQCQLGRLRMSVCLLGPTLPVCPKQMLVPACAQPSANPNPNPCLCACSSLSTRSTSISHWLQPMTYKPRAFQIAA